MLTKLEANRVEAFWPVLSHAVAQMCLRTHGRMDENDVLRLAKAGTMQIWLNIEGSGYNAVAVTELAEYPKKKYCRIVMGSGTNREIWQDYIEEIEQWARLEGCNGVESIARHGWARIFEKRGYEETHCFIEKELN